MKKIFDVIQVLNNLNNIKRTGPNLFAGIPNEFLESISEHSFKVAYLCLIFSKKVKKINLEKILKYSITDEWGECLLGDLPSSSPSYKSFFDADIRTLTKKAERRLQKNLLEDSGLSKTTLNKDEQIFFDFCDILARILEQIDLRQMGFRHKWIRQMYQTQIALLKEFEYPFVEELIEELDSLYKEGMDNIYLTKETK